MVVCIFVIPMPSNYTRSQVSPRKLVFATCVRDCDWHHPHTIIDTDEHSPALAYLPICLKMILLNFSIKTALNCVAERYRAVYL